METNNLATNTKIVIKYPSLCAELYFLSENKREMANIFWSYIIPVWKFNNSKTKIYVNWNKVKNLVFNQPQMNINTFNY